MVQVHLIGSLVVWTGNGCTYSGKDAVRYLEEHEPVLLGVARRVQTDLNIARVCQNSSYGSYILPGLFSFNNEKIQEVMTRWENQMSSKIYMTRDQKMAFYWTFFVVGHKKSAQDFLMPDITRWLIEHKIPWIRNGKATITIENGSVKAEVNTRGNSQQIEFLLGPEYGQDYGMKKYLEKATGFITDKLTQGGHNDGKSQ